MHAVYIEAVWLRCQCMIYLKQTDPRWRWQRIGNTESTIGEYGCTITCLSMLSDWYKDYKDPSDTEDSLEFLRDLVIWKSVEKKLPFRFVWRFYKRDMTALEGAMKGKDTACLLQVNGNHWVIGVRKSIYPWSKWWLTIDPLVGGKKWYHETNITGGATFIRNS